MDTKDNIQEVITVLLFGKIVATILEQSIELQNTVTSEIIRHMDSKSGMKIAFSPDGNQAAVLSNSLLTLWNINNLENHLLFNL